ncbi:hypothetical protein HPB47_019733 [Ixodes persulcatus]|uniref:Uncharacterized protein n=1 Tax=Ixodes persulcatus TaxID=34615 RepID=A0AC60QHB1_IXOPE|nr:hypothetical protein HPB47_019733 [Ixodes persulcatus]
MVGPGSGAAVGLTPAADVGPVAAGCSSTSVGPISGPDAGPTISPDISRGESFLTAKSFTICIDSQPVVHTSSPCQAFKLVFFAHFAFNIVYRKEASLCLEFMQRHAEVHDDGNAEAVVGDVSMDDTVASASGLITKRARETCWHGPQAAGLGASLAHISHVGPTWALPLVLLGKPKTKATKMSQQNWAAPSVVYLPIAPRIPTPFYGEIHEDVENWIQHYEGLACHNEWIAEQYL